MATRKKTTARPKRAAKPPRRHPRRPRPTEEPIRAASEGRAPPARRSSVVALGASAGGLEALKEFLSPVRADGRTAFVVITHQHAETVTLLPELLAKSCRLPVQVIADGMPVSENTVFVAPPGVMVSLEGDVFRLETSEGRRVGHSIDHFFRSLARARGEDAVAVVLSGTGNDGSVGVVEVKAAGGLVLAQDAGSARFGGMPASALGTRVVDAELPPGEMIGAIERHAVRQSDEPSPPEDQLQVLNRVLHSLRSRTGHDFTAYKKSTLWRRVERRVNMRNLKGMREYARFLDDTPAETEILFRELLISVTSFFRDPPVFDVLRRELELMLQQRPEDQPFRAWVGACATGEEAYSLAILIREILSDLRKQVPVQIFATDLDQHAVDFARAGRYPAGIAVDVCPERLDRFFVKSENEYRVCKEIREMVVFAAQNVIKDPPFTKLDLISCRNLLIYLEPDLQRRVLGLFNYALRPGGLLVLGTSESVSGFDGAFANVDKKCKLFRRRHTPADAPSEFPELLPVSSVPGQPWARRTNRDPGSVALVADKVLLAHLAPPSVIVTERGDIAYFHGRTGQFLEPASGEPVANVFGMVREGLRLELPAAMRQAAGRKETVVRSGLQVKSNGGFTSVKLTVRPLEEPEVVRGMLLVSFETEAESPARKKGAGKHAQEVARVDDLELELQHTRENLQGTIEELETSNEELKSTNEELQSTNEELQSANEELETSREEMQSLNEELQTVNSELEERNRALSQANDDMQNLLNSTEIATVFLDRQLAIKRFTTQARKVFSLIDTDIGRPISDLTANLRYDGLVDDANEVLQSLVFREREIQTREGAWRLMRIMPYRTAEDVIDGLVMTFVDIDRVKQEEQAAAEARRFADDVMEAIPDGVAVLDGELRIVRANHAFFSMLRTSAKRAVGEVVTAAGLLDSADLAKALPAVLAGGDPILEMSVRHSFGSSGSAKELRVGARGFSASSESRLLVLLTVRDASGHP